MNKQLREQMIVKNRRTGEIGVLCPTIYFLTSDGDDKLSVCYDGGLPGALNCEGGRDNFEVIGLENAIPTPEGCGFGLEEKCCIFVVGSSKGFECERYGSIRYDLIFRTMTAKREPTGHFPKCLLNHKEGKNE